MNRQQLAGRQMTLNEYEQLMGQLSEAEHQWLSQQQQVDAVIRIKGTLRCQRCNNQQHFEKIHPSVHYCTHCIQLGRLTTKDTLYRFSNTLMPELEMSQSTYLSWRGTLSNEQQRVSSMLVEHVSDVTKDDIVVAVTGAGKTEMIFEVINHVLLKKGRVAVASPRVDVCLELAPRLQQAFSEVDMIALHGKMDEDFRYTPFVVSTIHQLWKFYHAFDLIIVDEVDAFPLANDEGLHFAVQQALKPNGKKIYLTATPDQFLQNKIKAKQAEVAILPARFHGYPLPEPKFCWVGDWKEQIQQHKKGKLWQFLKKFLNVEGVKLVFMPSIEMADLLYQWIQEEGIDIKLAVVHSQDAQRIEKVQQLRNGELDALITTTILERGVTFKNCQVVIVGAEDAKYSDAALIQMSGRVGRNPQFPTGVLVYAHFGISRKMVLARRNIRSMNKEARKRGLLVNEPTLSKMPTNV
ncbi:DEAD/DEAH box helicase family protein [Aerococcaceae bacterium zg-BR9]|uniref:DEAD/DEAH box helicase n=1 Tax=Aerococcaceae bacterium zg-1292 TaxID=2774330 RepID=UPI004064439F|nr:DEAD/DEAH box helicase family protein [Aerococcaceae bacterium zg-BR9]MBF6979061.1 DEAD/DEAH box helicase family protein [Aerococcaceae bacterium zg-BR22]